MMTKKIIHSMCCAFSLTEVLVALLVVTITLGALAPVLTKKVTSDKMLLSSSKPGGSTPVGGIILWSKSVNLPDDTWLPCDGQRIPTGKQYDKLREMFGENIPNLNSNQNDTSDLKNYIDKKVAEVAVGKTFPKNVIAIWGTNDVIPEGWEEADEYRGVFLRGYGTAEHTQNNGSAIGDTPTTHTSGDLGVVQGDAMRKIWGYTSVHYYASGQGMNSAGAFYWGSGTVYGGGVGNYQTYGINFDASRIVPTDEEIRPVNKAVKYIKCSGGPSVTSTPEDLPETSNYTSMLKYIIKARP